MERQLYTQLGGSGGQNKKPRSQGELASGEGKCCRTNGLSLRRATKEKAEEKAEEKVEGKVEGKAECKGAYCSTFLPARM